MEFHMDFHKIWEEQCEATRTIRERFGIENALDYLIGEKLLNFAKAADQDPDFAAGLPRFQAAVWEIFNPYELRGYVASLKHASLRRRRRTQGAKCTLYGGDDNEAIGIGDGGVAGEWGG
jgi:hypothetical protein